MKRCVFCAVLTMILVVSAFAEDTIVFTNGNKIKGFIISETDDVIKFKMANGGMPFEIQKSEVKEVVRDSGASKETGTAPAATGTASATGTPPVATGTAARTPEPTGTATAAPVKTAAPAVEDVPPAPEVNPLKEEEKEIAGTGKIILYGLLLFVVQGLIFFAIGKIIKIQHGTVVRVAVLSGIASVLFIGISFLRLNAEALMSGNLATFLQADTISALFMSTLAVANVITIFFIPKVLRVNMYEFLYFGLGVVTEIMAAFFGVTELISRGYIS